MKKTIKRDDVIEKAIKLSTQHANLLLEWATGVGKSKAAIDIIKTLHVNGEPLKILLIVAETAHKNNWLEEFKKWDAMQHWEYVTIECYASLKNYKNTRYDLLILDEGHHSGTEIRLDVLKSIITKKVLILSATFKRDILEELERIFGKFHTFNIKLTHAIENDMLPVPKVYLIPLELNNSIPDVTFTMERGLKRNQKYITCSYKDRWNYLKDKTNYPDLKLTVTCTELEKYDHLSQQFRYFQDQYLRTRQEYLKNIWLQTGSVRKRFLGDIKTSKVLPLLHILQDKRYICFCSSIEQAESLGKGTAIHSEKKNSLEIIQKFNDKKIDTLFAVGMLQEGQNLTDIDAGVIIQLDGQVKSFIQKFGRTLRSNSPKQYIFYYENTRDEEYLEKILEEIDKKYIYFINDLTV